MEPSARSILVGYDDTSAAMAAVRWAAELAHDTGAGIRLLHAWTWPLLGQGLAGIPVLDPAGPRNQASRLLDDAAERIAAQHPDVPVSAELVAGMPREVLEEASAGADLLVVGTRGLGAVLGTLLGSVSRGLLHDAGCPVAIIRSDQHRAGPVLVAYDGSDTAGEAVDVAADLAAAWGSTLRVVHVRTVPQAPYGSGGEAWEAGKGHRVLLDEGVARARARQARVEVQSRMLEARTAAEGLLDAAAGARMLVLGHRGLSRGRFGSTAHATVLHATGNVTVVRHAPES
ncbi:universal stress protein [Brachybacterium paraconglomeratum]|uniref:universal stress protein n=1 Tax=Brachybacterium paraconglomeratum TaxID=173362 RepID=UPI0022B037F2|nr:universal stress protein [Brachybacterium paraconglomeratum]MCZ4325288.1 universal stress protein [Brachybacterium paraconglomeratum]